MVDYWNSVNRVRRGWRDWERGIFWLLKAKISSFFPLKTGITFLSSNLRQVKAKTLFYPKNGARGRYFFNWPLWILFKSGFVQYKKCINLNSRPDLGATSNGPKRNSLNNFTFFDKVSNFPQSNKQFVKTDRMLYSIFEQVKSKCYLH